MRTFQSQQHNISFQSIQHVPGIQKTSENASIRHSPSNTAMTPQEKEFFMKLRRHVSPPLPDAIYSDSRRLDKAGQVHKNRVNEILGDV